MLPFGTPPQGWIDDRKILADAAIRLPYVARGIEPDVSFGHSLGLVQAVWSDGVCVRSVPGLFCSNLPNINASPE